jgi:hypothetical protein
MTQAETLLPGAEVLASPLTLLLKHLREGLHSHKARDVHTEVCDHPTDREIIALGRCRFRLGAPAR